MSKWQQYMLDQLCRRRAATKPQEERRRHLYLVVDDWERGYTLRKIDIDDDDAFFFDSDADADAVDLDEEAEPLRKIDIDDDDAFFFDSDADAVDLDEEAEPLRKIDIDDDDAFFFFDSDSDADADAVDLDEEAEPLPEPPVARFNGPHCHLSLFGGHGTTILAMPVSSAADGSFPMFDIETLELNICASPGGHKVQGKPFFASVAGELYMVDTSFLSVLAPPPPPRAIDDENTQWSWTTVTSTLPSVRSNHVASSAVHPDGQTLFVSEGRSTFALDTESLDWTWQGNWVMPFQGQAYFDDELDAWVGLCRYKGGIGYMCCCDVPPAAKRGGGGGTTMPAWKLGKDKLFYANKTRHLGATLLSLGSGGNGGGDYCLIESLVHKVHRPGRRLIPGRRRRVLYVTRFGLKYDKNGELRTTRRRVRSYELTEAHEFNDLCFTPVAFWM